jgi:hypothetical protein
MNLANPEDSFLLGSTDIPSKVQGCTACTNPNIQRGGRRKNQKSQRKSQRKNRKLKGGFHIEFDPTQEFPMGPRGGLKPWTIVSKHIMNDDLTTQNFDNLTNTGDYTSAYAPLKSNTLFNFMFGGKKSKKTKTNKRGKRQNKNIRKTKKKYITGGKKQKHNAHVKSKRKIKKSRKHRRQKGGYHQYMSNIPHSAQYGLSDDVTPNTSMLANPIPIQKLDTCVDNYNHFTGKGFETGVFDQAPSMM